MRVVLALPEGAAPEATPALDLSALPGARATSHQAWRLNDGALLEVACVRAPVSFWVDGLEREVLGGATAVVASQRGLQIGTQLPVASRAGGFEQQYEAVEPGMRPAVGRHALGWLSSHDLGLCTTLCAGGTTDACARVVGSAEVVASFVSPPPAPAWLRALAWGAAHPLPTGGLVVSVLVALAAASVATRPRPRRRRAPSQLTGRPRRSSMIAGSRTYRSPGRGPSV